MFTLASAGVGKDVMDATVDVIKSNDFTYLDRQNAENLGALANTALALQVAGEDPTAFRGKTSRL